MNTNGFGWDLPPGVTDADIERHFEEPKMKTCPQCDGETVIEDEETKEQIQCPKCKGEGEIEINETDYEEPDYDDCRDEE